MRLDGGPAAGVVLSLLLHGGVTAIAVYAALHASPPAMVNTLTIRLAPMTPANAAPALPPVTPVLQEPRAVVEPPKAITATAPPAKNTAPPSPFGKSSKKASEVPVPPARPVAPPNTASSAAEIAPGTSGVTALEGGDFPYTM